MATPHRSPVHGPPTSSSGARASPAMHSLPVVGNPEGLSPPRTQPNLSPGPSLSFQNPAVLPFSTAPAATSFASAPGAGGAVPGGGSFKFPPDGSFSALPGRPLPGQQPSFTTGVASGGLGVAAQASPERLAPARPEFSPTTNSTARPLKLGSHLFGNAHGQAGSKVECQDQQCAEEECDPEECGDEHRAPNDNNYTCGIDRRPLLPVSLVTSTLLGAMMNMWVEFPLLRDTFNGAYWTRGFFIGVYTITLGCMAFCLLFDPGLLNREDRRAAYAKLHENGEAESPSASDTALLEDEPPLPKRCHKAWLYSSPIRRYDHFCRWLTNCIGLLNHREFLLMLVGLGAIGVLGGLMDVALLFVAMWRGRGRGELLCIALHLMYSMCLTCLAGPILRLHVGFVSRNELASEWKRNDFYVVTSLRTGKTVPVNELSDDEFNERFDAFEYDKSRNPWDKDTLSNCLSFWFTPRWTPGQLGEF